MGVMCVLQQTPKLRSLNFHLSVERAAWTFHEATTRLRPAMQSSKSTALHVFGIHKIMRMNCERRSLHLQHILRAYPNPSGSNNNKAIILWIFRNGCHMLLGTIWCSLHERARMWKHQNLRTNKQFPFFMEKNKIANSRKTFKHFV